MTIEQRFRNSKNKRKSECSIYTIGMILLQRLNASPPESMAALISLSKEVLGKWG